MLGKSHACCPMSSAVKPGSSLWGGATGDYAKADKFYRGKLSLLRSEWRKGTIGAEAEIYCVCQTGTRSQLAADMLRASAFRRVVHVDGGTNAWVGAGLPVERSAQRTISLERQVRIAAGSLMLIGVLAGALLHPAGYWFAGAIGAALAYAGVANFCGMSMLLARMPWNQPHARRTPSTTSLSSAHRD